jgi:hypothetical protein
MSVMLCTAFCSWVHKPRSGVADLRLAFLSNAEHLAAGPPHGCMGPVLWCWVSSACTISFTKRITWTTYCMHVGFLFCVFSDCCWVPVGSWVWCWCHQKLQCSGLPHMCFTHRDCMLVCLQPADGALRTLLSPDLKPPKHTSHVGFPPHACLSGRRTSVAATTRVQTTQQHLTDTRAPLRRLLVCLLCFCSLLAALFARWCLPQRASWLLRSRQRQ